MISSTTSTARGPTLKRLQAPLQGRARGPPPSPRGFEYTNDGWLPKTATEVSRSRAVALAATRDVDDRPPIICREQVYAAIGLRAGSHL